MSNFITDPLDGCIVNNCRSRQQLSLSHTSPALKGAVQGGLSIEVWFSSTETVVSQSIPKKKGIEYRSSPDRLVTRWIVDLNFLFVLYSSIRSIESDGEFSNQVDKQSAILTTIVPGIGGARIHSPLWLNICRPGTLPCSRIVKHSKSCKMSQS